MEKIKIHNHASVLIAYNGDKIISNLYDVTYPKEIWRNRANLIGGGQSKEDLSPRDLFEREINEEFSKKIYGEKSYDKNFSDVVGDGFSTPKVQNFASKKDMDTVKESILESYKPYFDFLAFIPEYKNKPAFKVLFSSYYWNVPDKILKIVEKNLKEKKSLVNEGFIKLLSLEDFVKGDILTAWITGPIMEDFFKVSIPNPEGVKSLKFGPPRESFPDYNKEFENSFFKNGKEKN